MKARFRDQNLQYNIAWNDIGCHKKPIICMNWHLMRHPYSNHKQENKFCSQVVHSATGIRALHLPDKRGEWQETWIRHQTPAEYPLDRNLMLTIWYRQLKPHSTWSCFHQLTYPSMNPVHSSRPIQLEHPVCPETERREHQDAHSFQTYRAILYRTSEVWTSVVVNKKAYQRLADVQPSFATQKNTAETLKTIATSRSQRGIYR